MRNNSGLILSITRASAPDTWRKWDHSRNSSSFSVSKVAQWMRYLQNTKVSYRKTNPVWRKSLPHACLKAILRSFTGYILPSPLAVKRFLPMRGHYISTAACLKVIFARSFSPASMKNIIRVHAICNKLSRHSWLKENMLYSWFLTQEQIQFPLVHLQIIILPSLLPDI